MPEFVFRAIDAAEDAAPAANIEKLCLETAWSEAQISNLPDYARYICAFCDGDMCGIASMYLIAGEAEIMNIAVLPEYRKKGVANVLLQKLISVASESSSTVMTLEVAEDNESAISLYKKHNFTVTGRRKGFYKGKDALNMEKKL